MRITYKQKTALYVFFIYKGEKVMQNLLSRTIEIIEMKGEPQYTGRTGVVEHIDDIGQLHGTWGGLAVVPSEDTFKVIDTKRDNFLDSLISIANYWKDKENGSFGAVFSVLVLIDGCDSHNNFERLEIKGITNNRELHTDFCARR